jgi:hypothetical protein
MSNETFISYAHADFEFVDRLELGLRRKGFDPWIDHEDIPAAVKWEPEMLLGVQFCHNFIFVLSPQSLASKDCKEELKCALRHNKRLIPILYQSCRGYEIHPALAELNWIFFNNFDAGLEKLVRVISLPREQMGSLTDRSQASVQVRRYNGTISEPFPLYRSCYWVGRQPIPPSDEAGAIIVRDPSFYISRVHLELKILNGKWYAVDRSRHGFYCVPPSPDGHLKENTLIILGSGIVLDFRIVRQEEPEEVDPRETAY